MGLKEAIVAYVIITIVGVVLSAMLCYSFALNEAEVAWSITVVMVALFGGTIIQIGDN